MHQSEEPNDDLVSCIFLGAGGGPSEADCPLQVHTFRCDSGETASILAKQLKSLVHQNRSKLDAIEARLAEKGLLRSSSAASKVGSDGRSLGRSSDDSSELSSPAASKPSLVNLHECLAAELRQKFCQKSPLLLPPKDYDTVHRTKGNLSSVDARRALNPAVVGSSKNPGKPLTGKSENFLLFLYVFDFVHARVKEAKLST